jgi:hypothetical protein
MMRKDEVLFSMIIAAVMTFGVVFFPATATTGEQETASTAEIDNAVVAYYFHGNKRCSTCRKLEAYSEEAITGGFAAELEAGEIQWRTVNTDQSDNAHFVTDFELVTKSLVLVEYRNGDVVRWQNLKLIWQLVREKDGFITYVREGTREFLEEG